VSWNSSEILLSARPTSRSDVEYLLFNGLSMGAEPEHDLGTTSGRDGHLYRLST